MLLKECDRPENRPPVVGALDGRKREYDILKAWGIVSIVLGHCLPYAQAINFVYSYHLALFLFAAGLQFNEEKYCTAPFLFLQSRMRSLWPPFFGYLSFFTLTHDWSLQAHLIMDSGPYGYHVTVFRLINNYLFLGSEILGAALWFVPVMLIVMLLFAGIAYFSHSFCRRFPLIPIMALSALLGSVGVYCNINAIQLLANAQTALVLLPVFTAGFLFRHFRFDFEKVFRWFVALPCLLFVCWAVIQNGHHIELSLKLIGGSGLYFYSITFCGLYAVCYVVTLLNRCPKLAGPVSFIGRYTFDIMALHMLLFKIVDVVYGKSIGVISDVYAVFPCAFRFLWPVYTALAVFLPPFIRLGVKRLYTALKAGLQQ